MIPTPPSDSELVELSGYPFRKDSVADVARRADDRVHQARVGVQTNVRVRAEVVSRPRELPLQPLAVGPRSSLQR